MTGNEYQQKALRTAGEFHGEELMLNGVMGICGEGGEACDLLKKHLFQGHDLDKEHFAKELGDCLWYIAVAAEGAGYKLDDIMSMNIEKLKKRYPDGFEAELSINRKSDDI